MALKFYMTPGSCSTGIHILLEELGLIFEAYIVNLLAGDQNESDFLEINPKGSIPVLLLEDGHALTEYQAIAWWLAREFPETNLLPLDPISEVKVLEVMNYVVSTLHMQGFARIFTTEKFCDDPLHDEEVKSKGKEIVENGFRIVAEELNPSGFVSDHFSIADTALFYTEFWAVKTGISLPVGCERHYQLLLGRPPVRRVLLEEGYTI